MANRPKIGQLKRDLENLKRQVKENTEEIKKVKKREIIEMLKEKNTPTSSRDRYTYEEIAEYIGCSPATVSNIAKENGLSRRNLKVV